MPEGLSKGRVCQFVTNHDDDRRDRQNFLVPVALNIIYCNDLEDLSEEMSKKSQLLLDTK